MRLTEKQRFEKIKNLPQLTKADKEFLDYLYNCKLSYEDGEDERIRKNLDEYYHPKRIEDWY